MRQLLTICSLLAWMSLGATSDSLKRVLKEVSGEEEVRVLMKLSEYYEQYDLDSALWYADDAVQKARELDNPGLLGESYNGRGIIYDFLGQYDLALADYFRALDLHRSVGDERSVTGTLINIGLIYSFQSRLDSALAYYEMALEKSIALKERNYESYVRHNMGSLQLKQGHYRLALEHYLRSLELKEELGDEAGIQYSLYNLGLVYYNLNLPRKALENYYKILERETEEGTMMHGDVYHNMGVIYQNALKKSDSALYFYRKALQIRRSVGYIEGIAETLGNLGTLQLSLGNPDSAMSLLKEGLEIDQQSGDQYRVALSYRNLASAYLAQDDATTALHLVDLAMSLADSFDMRSEYPPIYRTKVNVLRALGRYAEALDYYDRYTQLSDSILNEEISEQLLELETQYQTAKKDREILEQKIVLDDQARSIERKNRWIAITVAGVLTLGLILLLLFWNARNKQRLHRQQMATLQREQELQSLKAMIAGEERERSRIAKNLHDGISGMLSAIKLYFTSLGRDEPKLESQESYNKARTLIDDTAKEVRSIAHNLMPDLLARDGLAEALRQFCQHIQGSGLLQVDFQAINMEERLSKSMELTLYRIIQELLNNIMKHAHATEVLVQLSRQSNRVECTVEDNGRGFDVEGGAQGAGLETIRSRLQYLDGELDIDSSEGHGTSVHIVVTLDKHQS